MPNPFISFTNPFQKSKDGQSNDIKIGTPTNFKHNIQVIHDKDRNEFIGLPDDWKILLEKNNLK